MSKKAPEPVPTKRALRRLESERDPGESAAPAACDRVLMSASDPTRAQPVELLLASMGIPVRVQTDPVGGTTLYVAGEHLDTARTLMEEEYPFGTDRPRDGQLDHSFKPRHSDDDAKVSAPTAWFGRGTVALLGIVVACCAVFAASAFDPDAGQRSTLIDYGAITWTLVQAGEHWRLLTAVFLHFDGAHLASNMLTFLLIAPPFAHQVGGWRLLLVFCATGVAGNIASHVLAPSVGLKAGASGGVAGILGALGGHALRHGAMTESRYRPWHRIGAIAAFYGLLIGFGPGRDNVAHIGGLVAGILFGRFTRPLPELDSSDVGREAHDPFR